MEDRVGTHASGSIVRTDREFWAAARQLLVDLASPVYSAELEALLDEPEGGAPRTWKTRMAAIMEKAARTDGANDRLTRVVVRLVDLKQEFEAAKMADPEYFGSPLGQALLTLARAGKELDPDRFFTNTPMLLRKCMADPERLQFAPLARAAEEMSFEPWATSFCRCFQMAAERWYKPLLTEFVSFTRTLVARPGQIPAELGRVMQQARDLWTTHQPALLPLLNDRIRLVRNSEGHGHTELDIANLILTFSNEGSGRRETWTAAKMDLLEVAKDLYHSSELMELALGFLYFEAVTPEIFTKAGIFVD